MDDKAWLQLFIQLTGGYADVMMESRSRTNLSTLEPDTPRCINSIKRVRNYKEVIKNTMFFPLKLVFMYLDFSFD